jgi:hypothetical protein
LKDELWNNNLQLAEEYIIKYKSIDKYKKWLLTQIKWYHKSKYIMKNENNKQIFNTFIEKYKKYLPNNILNEPSNKFSSKQLWNNSLKLLEDFIIKNKCSPSSTSNLGKWLINQTYNYKNNRYIMKNQNINNIWKMFVDKHKDILKNRTRIFNYELLKNNLKLLEDYIIKNNKLPTVKDTNKKYAIWLFNQKSNYTKHINIMKTQHIRELWELFIEKYKKFFRHNNSNLITN